MFDIDFGWVALMPMAVIAVFVILGLTASKRARRWRMPSGSRVCWDCGASMPAAARYCPQCGHRARGGY